MNLSGIFNSLSLALESLCGNKKRDEKLFTPSCVPTEKRKDRDSIHPLLTYILQEQGLAPWLWEMAEMVCLLLYFKFNILENLPIPSPACLTQLVGQVCGS